MMKYLFQVSKYQTQTHTSHRNKKNWTGTKFEEILTLIGCREKE